MSLLSTVGRAETLLLNPLEAVVSLLGAPGWVPKETGHSVMRRSSGEP